MDDLISRQAAIEEFQTEGSCFVYGRDACKAIISRIKQLPSVDAVPVIRCRDCKYAKRIYIKNLPWIKQWEYSCQYFNTHSVMGDGYCNNAERKEE